MEKSENKNLKNKEVNIWLAPHWGKSNHLFENSMLNRETVVFRDKSKVTVFEENQLIGEYLIRLEQDALENPLTGKDDLPRQVFRQAYYSKLLACSVGDVPSDEETLVMPSSELQKWIDAARKINPNFFVNLDKVVEEVTAEEKKRKRRRPRK